MWLVTQVTVMSIMSMTAVSTYTWFIMWVCMEGLLMMLIPTLTGTPTSNEASMKYFLIQALSAMVFLFSVLSPISMKPVIVFSLLLKMGLFPFHFWVPHVFSGVTFMNMLWLSTVMKLPALVLISHWTSGVVWPVFLISVMLSSVAAMHTSSLKKILGWSSVNHTSWLLVLTASGGVWVLYFVWYSIILAGVTMLLTINHTSSIYTSMNSLGFNHTVVFTVNLLSLAGMPPLMGFYMKWLALTEIMSVSGWLGLTLLLSLTLTLYFYVQVLLRGISQPLLTGSTPTVNVWVIITFVLNMLGLVFVLSFL